MVKPVTVKVDEELWKKLKAAAKKRGVVLTVAVEDALYRQLQLLRSDRSMT